MAEHPSFREPGVPAGEPVQGETYRADGWALCPLPAMSPASMENFKAVIGESNIVWMSFFQIPEEGEPLFQSGVCLISPEGLERVSRYRGPVKAVH